MFVIIKNANDVKITFVVTNATDLSVHRQTYNRYSNDNTYIICIVFFNMRSIAFLKSLCVLCYVLYIIVYIFFSFIRFSGVHVEHTSTLISSRAQEGNRFKMFVVGKTVYDDFFFFLLLFTLDARYRDSQRHYCSFNRCGINNIIFKA